LSVCARRKRKGETIRKVSSGKTRGAKFIELFQNAINDGTGPL
jgi:hypothetical protein